MRQLNRMSETAEFENAAEYVRKMPPKPETTNSVKLEFYGLFKQAKEGDNTDAQPWAIQVEARAKWEAWKAVAGKSKSDAMKAYIALLDKIEPSWRSQ